MGWAGVIGINRKIFYEVTLLCNIYISATLALWDSMTVESHSKIATSAKPMTELHPTKNIRLN